VCVPAACVLVLLTRSRKILGTGRGQKPGGFYDVRWFRADDRGKLVEITRERFQLRNHSTGPRRGSISQTNPRLAPKALPISEDDIKPRRLAPENGAQRGRDQATEGGRGPLAFLW
jgi:hypothetical protein